MSLVNLFELYDDAQTCKHQMLIYLLFISMLSVSKDYTASSGTMNCE
jgi:hypothetical protein